MSNALKALKCCREKRCKDCPMLGEFCDELRVDMVDIPEELAELIEKEMEEMEERIDIMMEGKHDSNKHENAETLRGVSADGGTQRDGLLTNVFVQNKMERTGS